MELWELAAREAIRDLVARYNQNGDAGRFDPMLALFAPDATLEVPGEEPLRGASAIRAFFERVAHETDGSDGRRFVRHFVASHQIDLSSEREARGRSYYVVLTDGGPDHWGRYVDHYRCTPEGWRFQQRRITVDAARPGGWADR